MRSRRLLLALSAVALVSSACSTVPRDALAVVNGQEIAEADLVTAIREAALDAMPAGGLSPADVADLAQRQRAELSLAIQIALIEQAAAARGVSVDEGRIDEQYDFEVVRVGSEEELIAQLEAVGLTPETWREQVRIGLLVEALRDDVIDEIEITDADVEALYDQRAAQWEVADVSHILVDDEAFAEELLAQIEAGEISFEDAASEHSQDPLSGLDGGSLGEAGRGSYVEPFEVTVWAATPGVLYGPVQSNFGFHLIRVNAFRTVSLDEVAERLADELRGAQADFAWETFVLQVFEDAEVEVDGRIGRWDPEGPAVVADDLA